MGLFLPSEGTTHLTTMNLQSRLATHFAAAAALAAVTATATAQVATQVINQVVPATTAGIYVNVETGVWSTSPASAPGWDINPWSSSSLSLYSATGVTGGTYMRFPGVTTGSGGNLAFGTVIDGTGSYGSGATTFGTAPGNWQLNADNYFGFQFVASDNLIHYGWGRMTVGATNLIRTLQEVHWEMTAGAPIVTDGATSMAYGTGCAGLSLAADTSPHFGAPVTYTLSGIPATAALSILYLNFGVANAGTPLDSFGLVGCSDYVNLVGASPNLLFNTPSDSFVFNVPSATAFLGLPIVGQGATLDNNLPSSAALSNGIASIVGS
jgi:hypothetical protein